MESALCLDFSWPDVLEAQKEGAMRLSQGV